MMSDVDKKVGFASSPFDMLIMKVEGCTSIECCIHVSS